MINPYYNQNYTKQEIKQILDVIKECVKSGRYVISMNSNRIENIGFINEYGIYPNKRKKILMQVEVEDFCHSLNNIRKGYENEILYVFVPKVNLYNAVGVNESIYIYMKFNIIDTVNEKKTIVISFHKLNRPIKYLFKK